MRMAGKKAAGKSNLVNQQHAESKTEQTGNKPQPLRKTFPPFAHKGKGGRNAHGNQHHAANRSQTKNQQIDHSPTRIGNGGQHQQSYGSGARKPMDYANDKRPYRTIQRQLAEEPIQQRQWCAVKAMRMRLRRVPVRMAMNIVAMGVCM